MPLVFFTFRRVSRLTRLTTLDRSFPSTPVPFSHPVSSSPLSPAALPLGPANDTRSSVVKKAAGGRSSQLPSAGPRALLTAPTGATGQSAKKRQKAEIPSKENSGGKEKAAAAPAGENFSLNRLAGVGGDGDKRKEKGLSKKKLLAKAEAVQEVVAEGGVKAERHAWSAAMKRAAGEK
eukprot:1180356-Prorocentrum_minimum.AAC.1